MTNSTARIEVAYVVDTHALAWYLTKRERLSNHALAIFQAAERGETLLIVPAIVVAELLGLTQLSVEAMLLNHKVTKNTKKNLENLCDLRVFVVNFFRKAVQLRNS